MDSEGAGMDQVSLEILLSESKGISVVSAEGTTGSVSLTCCDSAVGIPP